MTAQDTPPRPFGFWMATAMVIGAMIGAGIFVLPAQLAAYGATGAVAWMVAVAGALVLAVLLTRLSRARSDATGLVAIAGDAMGPMAGLLVGWSYWATNCASLAALSLSAVRYLSFFVPAVGETSLRAALAAVAIVWLLTLLNLRGAKAAGRFGVLTVGLRLLPLLLVIVLIAGFAFAGGGQFTTYPHAAFNGGQLTPALGIVFYALIGFETASVAAQRVQDPARNIVRATLTGVTLAGIIYLVVCSGIIYALPETAVANSPAPVADFVGSFLGPVAGRVVAAFALVSVVGCLNVSVFLVGEIPLGMARAGLLPAWFGRLSGRGVSGGVILLSSGLGTLLVLSNATGTTRALYDRALLLTTATNMLFYIGACLAALFLRLALGWAAVGAAFSVWVLYGAGLEPTLWGIALTLTGLPLYWFRPGRRAMAAAMV